VGSGPAATARSDRHIADGRHEYGALVRDVLAVPGADPDTPLVAVSRSGAADGVPLAACWGPEDLVRAWRPR
jgi:uncharacterized protein